MEKAICSECGRKVPIRALFPVFGPDGTANVHLCPECKAQASAPYRQEDTTGRCLECGKYDCDCAETAMAEELTGG